MRTYLHLSLVMVFPLLVFVAVFGFGFQPNYLESLVLIFGIPSLYMSFLIKEEVKKVTLFSLAVSIPIALIVELIAFYDKAWIVPQSVFPFRIFGFSPLENYIWQFLTVYTIVIFYEHFCHKGFQPRVSKKIWGMDFLLYSSALLAVLLFVNNSPLLHVRYPYLWFCVPFFIIPIVLFLLKYPRFFKSFLYTQAFFLYIHLIFELIGVKLGHWVYASHNYLGWVALFGQTFPLEEFVFVMLIGAFAACTYYEYFTDETIN